MSVFYLRLSTYVAAWLRNRDAASRAEDHVRMPSGIMADAIIRDNVVCNASGRVCANAFSSRQWMQMRRGMCIDPGSTDYGKVVMRRAEQESMQLHDIVLKLSGLPMRRGGGYSEWVPVLLPRQVTGAGGQAVAVTDIWMLDDNAAAALAGMLNDMCWDEFEEYMSRDAAYCAEHGIVRTASEAMERLMERYDIPSDDKATLRRTMFRRRKEGSNTQGTTEDETEHGD